jgi:hypothetical protein
MLYGCARRATRVLSIRHVRRPASMRGATAPLLGVERLTANSAVALFWNDAAPVAAAAGRRFLLISARRRPMVPTTSSCGSAAIGSSAVASPVIRLRALEASARHSSNMGIASAKEPPSASSSTIRSLRSAAPITSAPRASRWRHCSATDSARRSERSNSCP